MNKQINFLVGLPRAGNTIFSSIINQNSKVAVTANSITNEISNNTNPGPPIMASAPHQSALKEIVIRSTE